MEDASFHTGRKAWAKARSSAESTQQ